MEQNKLKLKDYCLTIEQAKELQALGVNMSDSMMVHFTLIDGTKIICERYELSGDKDYIDTLTNTEMIEMLPMDIEAKSKKYGNQTVYLSIDRHSVMYCVSGIEFERGLYVYISFEKPLLRDALFEMMKWLKINKLM